MIKIYIHFAMLSWDSVIGLCYETEYPPLYTFLKQSIICRWLSICKAGMEIVTVYEMSNFTQTIPFLIGKASKWWKILWLLFKTIAKRLCVIIELGKTKIFGGILTIWKKFQNAMKMRKVLQHILVLRGKLS